MATDLARLWKRTPTPEIAALVKKLMERYDARDVAKDAAAFSDELGEVLFLAFKAGVEAAKN